MSVSDHGSPAAGPGSIRGRQRRAEEGMVSLEAVWVLPALVALAIGLIHTTGLVRDVLLLHEAARAGARAAATSSGPDEAEQAARVAAPELDLTVHVDPSHRRAGDLVTVEVRSTRSLGPVRHPLRARAVARVEPIVGPASPRPPTMEAP